MVGMASSRGCCLACNLVRSAWMYSSVPTGNPRTRRPRWALGWSWPPTQTASDCDKAVMPGGTVPEAFHTCVLPWCNCMPVWCCKWWAKRSKSCLIRCGGAVT